MITTPSVYLLMPLTVECEQWIETHVEYEYKYGRGIPVELRYIEGIVVGLRENGFVPGEDFSVMN